MERVVEFFAPRSRFDFVVKWLAFYIPINLINYAIEGGATGYDSYNIAQQAVIIAVVGGPFITLGLAMLAHQRRLQDRLFSIAATDMLTGLLNRRAFLADASRAHKTGDGGALLVIDADHFKAVNDTFGHDVGDYCLRSIAEHLRASVRADDVVGRLGGEEFAIYLRNASAERARAVGERICSGIELDPSETNKKITVKRLKVTMSAGAVLARAGVTIENGLSVADRALYLAKEAGRARVIFAPF
ncbi:MAG: GGDEF domain-containing protein [Rhodobacteraceae bacterium]|nr:GGDEF domain-containing protein [Paracoccaceae bacterium]